MGLDIKLRKWDGQVVLGKTHRGERRYSPRKTPQINRNWQNAYFLKVEQLFAETSNPRKILLTGQLVKESNNL